MYELIIDLVFTTHSIKTEVPRTAEVVFARTKTEASRTVPLFLLHILFLVMYVFVPLLFQLISPLFLTDYQKITYSFLTNRIYQGPCRRTTPEA